MKASIEATAKLCTGLGHDIIEVKNPVSGQEFLDAFLTVWASIPVQLVQLAISLKLTPEDVLEPWTIGLAEFFAKKPKDALAKSLAYFKTVEAAMDAFFSVAYTPIHNVAGTPAMSVPLGWAKNGLPIGSQFAAAKGDDGLLYALAYELEQARPWAEKHGVVWAG